MKILGINGLNHDAAVALIEDGEVLFAGHSERYTGNKNDSDLNDELIADCLRYGKPDKIAYFERPYLKKLRSLIPLSSTYMSAAGFPSMRSWYFTPQESS